MHSTPNMVCRLISPCSRKSSITPRAIAIGANKISRIVSTCAAVAPSTPKPMYAPIADAIATRTRAIATRMIAARR